MSEYCNALVWLLLLYLIYVTMANSYLSIAEDAMFSVFNRKPRGFQTVDIPHLLKMLSGELHPAPVLMVQPTGCRKSIVPLTTGVISGGITLLLENTLALGTDQASKVNKMCSPSFLDRVKAFHLDTFKNQESQDKLAKNIILHCKKHSDTSLFLFSSPETLLKPLWKEFIFSIKQNLCPNL